jgi:trigger factor
MSRASSHAHGHSAHPEEHHHPGLTLAVEKKPGKAEVRLTITADELERARGREFAALSRRVTLKGFRPGKTPRALLEKHWGDEVEKQVAEHFLQHAYEQAVEEHTLRPATYPRIALDQNLPKKGEPWSIGFDILLRPQLTLGEVEGLEVAGRRIEVDDDELERALAEIRRANSHAEPAGEEPLAEDGLAVARIDFFRPGSDEACLAREGVRLSPRTPPPGVDPSAFGAALVGVRAGEERVLELEFPAAFPVAEARGERGTLRLAVGEVLRIVPPRDEELFKAFEVSDEAGLRAAVRARMLAAKQEAEEERIEAELLERMLEAHPMELPGELVDDQVEAHETELCAKLVEQGLDETEARTRAESERARSRAGAERALRAVYLIEEIARAKELKVSQEDVASEVKAIAERNGTTPAEVAEYYREQGLLRQLGLELLERKVRRYLRASAAIRLPG